MLSSRIIVINSPMEAAFALRFIQQPVALSFNRLYTAMAVDTTTVFIYNNDEQWESIINIFSDPNITKLLTKPAPAVNNFLHGAANINSILMADFIFSKVGGGSCLKSEDNPSAWKYVNDMNLEIISAGYNSDLLDVASNVALIVMKYYQTISALNLDLCNKNSGFNSKRDCFLLYLTAYNDLISKYGPLSFTDLIHRVKDYSNLCQIEFPPALILENLISTGIFTNDPMTTLVSIP